MMPRTCQDQWRRQDLRTGIGPAAGPKRSMVGPQTFWVIYYYKHYIRDYKGGGVNKFSSLHRRILVNGFGAQRAKVGGLKGRERCGALGEGQPDGDGERCNLPYSGVPRSPKGFPAF